MVSVGHQQGRKSVDKNVAAQAVLSPQDLIWQTIRRYKGEFSVAEICIALTVHQGINQHTVRSYVYRLHKGGFLQVTRTVKRNNTVDEPYYLLIKDSGHEAPRLTKMGKPTIQGLGREQMWRAIKILGEFSYIDLAATANTETCKVSPATAKDYIKHLYRAEYLACMVDSKPGKPARYRLLPSRNTGPKPPMIQKVKRVFDPNLNKIMWDEEEGSQ